MRDSTAGNRSSEEVQAALADLEKRLAQIQAPEPSRDQAASRQTAGSRLRRVGLFLAGFCLSGLLPFVLLIRGGMWVQVKLDVNTWLALAIALPLAALPPAVYSMVILHKLSVRASFRTLVTRVFLPAVVFFAGYSLVYLSAENVKNAEERQYFTRLHPFLRIAVSSLTLFDSSVLVTDMERSVEDYAAMGLPAYERSLHIVQRDGYVHALDLRTTSRSAVRNWLTVGYFRALGFFTLRHVGTADHLHVSMPRGFPGNAASATESQ